MSTDNDARVSIHWDAVSKINFACHQSGYSILRDLRIENLDEQARLDDLSITLSTEPAFSRPRTWKIDRIPPGGSVEIRDHALDLDGSFLHGLTEAIRGRLILSVARGGQVLAEASTDAELLAYNEWGGARYMPELLAAFCTPNDPAIDRILHSAALALRRADRPDSFDGYSSGSRERVWEVASAIYAAISDLGLSYAHPPTSFERKGQKIRLPSQILDGRVATCLDITMLFAATLEKAGLNPILVLPEGHALVGVWLQPETLASMVVDDAEVLRKRRELNELLLIETTLVSEATPPPFSRALERAGDAITPTKDPTFGAAVEIQLARAHRIRPIPQQIALGRGAESKKPTPLRSEMEQAPSLPDFDYELEQEIPDTPGGRLERWQRKLLDLSLRNPLLNHRSSKTSLQIICPDPGHLEDRLAANEKISIQPTPRPASHEQADENVQRRDGHSISTEYAREALMRKQVLVDLPDEELSRRAVEIYRKAQTSLQEGGANTLFLALGFLTWKREKEEQRRFRAPLILLPVTLTRKTARSGIRMSAHDDDPRFNTTLLEMLRKDFQIDIPGLEGELPADQSGIDVAGVWDKVRRAIKETPGFEVVEEVVLGHFSFAKYLMWKDLADRLDALKKNAIVRHLIETPKDRFETSVEFVSARSLDHEFQPSDLLAPLPADGSQMAAVATADRGKNFIIIGPPGTGKSQTISNMIAHLLGTGRTVLFVSEKTAALNVVHRRLAEIGLGTFCLQLHSNKAKKAEVLAQLATAWSGAGARSPRNWEKESRRLADLRDSLNRVVGFMHTTRRNGLTPHHAIGTRVRDQELATRVKFGWRGADSHDAEQLEKMRNAANSLRIQAEAVGELRNSKLEVVANYDWSPQWETELLERANSLVNATTDLQRASEFLIEQLGLRIIDRKLAALDGLAELSEVLQASYRKETGFAFEDGGVERIEALEEAVTRLKAYAQHMANLSVRYEPQAWLNLDGKALQRRWDEAQSQGWLRRQWVRWQIVWQLRRGGASASPDPSRDGATLAELRAESEAIERLDARLSGFRKWEGTATDPAFAEELHDLAQRARKAVASLSQDIDQLKALQECVRSLLREANDGLGPEGPVGRALADFLRAWNSFEERAAAFRDRAGRGWRDLIGEEDHALDHLKETLETLVSHKSELNQWCSWRKRRAAALDLGLGPLIESIEDGRTPIAEIAETFEVAYCTWFSTQLFEEEELLRSWSTPEHNDLIKKFRELDETFQKTTAAYAAAQISARIEGQDGHGKNTQWGQLGRYAGQKRPRIPIRKLVEIAPEPISRLTPCLMMSPLSVAQYLPPDLALFDVVIFDEASQVTVWDAVGAIARGKQMIVAGDPKQMPPTNFFSRADDDPDGEIDLDGDMESILDELSSSSIPEQTLNLHYRSRRESLIAFSNYHYYGERLVTFPAPVHPDYGVRLIPCEGHYARAKARNNRGEAEAIVAEVKRRLTSENAEEREASIGVVTFNSEQQSLILDLLDKLRAADPSIEWAFAEDSTEPLFVKNLETVQGDERDVILFSITYGPDKTGHLTMNFGPLNRSGGERRLNVAMTRARSEMLVFSTLRADQIDLSRTSAEAVKDLKNFLRYAEHGPGVLGAGSQGSLGDFESPFETAVARGLREKGWNVQPQIGVSAYRIDLGIVHPDEPGIYVAGVECDGAMYHSSAYARERDKIRQGVLENLGWTLFRVWSTDWWINRQRALDQLDGMLRDHLKADRSKREDTNRPIAAETESGAAPGLDEAE
jgi:very-short-patch-repair endonuclease